MNENGLRKGIDDSMSRRRFRMVPCDDREERQCRLIERRTESRTIAMRWYGSILLFPPEELVLFEKNEPEDW